MPPIQPLAELRKYLEAQIRDGQLPEALNALLALVPEGLETYRIVSALIARLNAANKERYRNTITFDEYQRRVDQVSADFFDLLAALTEASFETKPASTKASAGKNGSVLYHVPQVMRLQILTRCTIRVAVSEDEILENIVLDKFLKIKSSVEISDVMSAELLDPEGGTFKISTLNTRTQLVRDTGYTEWIFNVTPLIDGLHQLLVKVSIMEMMPGFAEPIPREVTLMETVTIVAESAAPNDVSTPEFKSSGLTYSFQSSATAQGYYEISYSTAVNSPDMTEQPEPRRSNRSLRALALLLLFLIVVPTATFVIAPDIPAWAIAHYIQGTPSSYAVFIEEHPNSPRIEKAYFYMAETSGQLADFQNYQDRFPHGRFEAKIPDSIIALETKTQEKYISEDDYSPALVINWNPPSKTGTGSGGSGSGKAGSGGITGGTGDNPFGKSNGDGGGSGGGSGTGSGASIGGGLGGRRVVSRGQINNDFQKEGKIVINICVDREGSVISAEYTMIGSTTSDPELTIKSIDAAKSYCFAPSSEDQSCGAITFNFRFK